MTLRLAYSLGLVSTLLLAMLTVLAGGELPLLCWLAPASALATFVRMRREGFKGRPLIGTVLAVCSFVWAVSIVAMRGTDGVLVGAAVALLGAMVARLEARSSMAHDSPALLLSLLLVFAGAGLHTRLTYGVVFVLFAVAAAWTLTTRQLWLGAEREAARPDGTPAAVTLARRDLATPSFFGMIGGTALAILVATSCVFAVFPRVGLGRLAFLSRAQAGLPDGVLLDTSPRGLSGGDVVARVAGLSFAQFERGLYLRAAAYEEPTARGYERARIIEREHWREKPLVKARRAASYEVFLQPVVGSQLPVLGPFRRAQVLSGGGLDLLRAPLVSYGPQGDLFAIASPNGPIRYRVEGELMVSEGSRADEAAPLVEAGSKAGLPRTLSPMTARGPALEVIQPELARNLRLAAGIDERVLALARELAPVGAEPLVIAARMRDYLTGNFLYTLEPANQGKPDPLAAFLFEDRRGHCEFFATAFATLLRAASVPARVVGGFAFGQWDPAAEVVVFSASSAHAWVEWYDPQRGWVLDDATPADAHPPARLHGFAQLFERMSRAWDENVLEFGLEHQFALLRQAAGILPRRASLPTPSAAAALGILGAGVMVVVAIAARGRFRFRSGRHGRRSALSPLTRALIRACERVRGKPLRPSETLRDVVAESAAQLSGDQAQLLHAGLALYERSRFGPGGEIPLAMRTLVREVARVRRPE